MDRLDAIHVMQAARESMAPVSPRAAAIVDAIVEDLCDRRGLKWEWAKIDDDIKVQIKDVWGRLVDGVGQPNVLQGLHDAQLTPAQAMNAERDIDIDDGV